MSIIRDTVESVWVAIILAFVLRAFMVEAFVIPTGSMAPRLMGEHYDLTCPACGFEYSYGWQSDSSVHRRDRTSPAGARCPSCTYRFQNSGKYVNGGDRVLVMKYLYKFVEPKPFDVIVFRNPQSNANNYIKRLIGLPGETLEIVHGDVYVTANKNQMPEGGGTGIRRKPDRAQAVMWQTISDNDYQPDMTKLAAEGMYIGKPRRWEPIGQGDKNSDGPWEGTNNGRNFVFKGSGKSGYLEFRGAAEIDQHVDPSQPEHFMREAFVPRYGYNPEQYELRCLDPSVDLCGDLKLSMVVRPTGEGGSAQCVLDGLWFSVKAVFDADGTVTVLRKLREPVGAAGGSPETNPAKWVEWSSAKTAPMSADKGRSVEVAHVDHSVKVWIDGKKVIDKVYFIGLNKLKARLAEAYQKPLPIPGARIGASGGPLELTHLKLMRDVYYTDFKLSQSGRESLGFLTDYAAGGVGDTRIGSPGWGVAGNPISLRKADASKGEDSDLDEFFVLGDNSPQSLDSRGWIEAAPSLRLHDSEGNRQYKLGTIPRYNMIGKAMFVYWPSGYRLPLLPGLPIIPDVGRMRLIR